MGHRPRGAEPERSGLDGLGGQLAHLSDLRRRRHLSVVGTPVAHDVAAQGGVGDLGADVEGERCAGNGVEVFGEALPAPPDALMKGGARNVLDTLHQLDQPFVLVRFYRGEADPAVPHDRSGHAMPRGRREVRVPRDLTVVVGVHVDPAGGDEPALGVNLLPAPAGDRPHGGDAVPVDGHIGDPPRRSGPVDDETATDHDVMLIHWKPPQSGCIPP